VLETTQWRPHIHTLSCHSCVEHGCPCTIPWPSTGIHLLQLGSTSIETHGVRKEKVRNSSP
jgi:hypothetical protein